MCLGIKGFILLTIIGQPSRTTWGHDLLLGCVIVFCNLLVDISLSPSYRCHRTWLCLLSWLVTPSERSEGLGGAKPGKRESQSKGALWKYSWLHNLGERRPCMPNPAGPELLVGCANCCTLPGELMLRHGCMFPRQPSWCSWKQLFLATGGTSEGKNVLERLKYLIQYCFFPSRPLKDLDSLGTFLVWWETENFWLHSTVSQ